MVRKSKYDFGELGRWSEQSLKENSSRGWRYGYTVDAIRSLYEDKKEEYEKLIQRFINGFESIFSKPDVFDFKDAVRSIDKLDKLNEDYKKFTSILQKLMSKKK